MARKSVEFEKTFDRSEDDRRQPALERCQFRLSPVEEQQAAATAEFL